MRLVLLFIPLFIAACDHVPPPVNPEFQEAHRYLNLSVVPPRPEVAVPLNQRTEWKKELTTANAQAQQEQKDAGLYVPDEAPTPPAELPK